jgi:hypothetical protein
MRNPIGLTGAATTTLGSRLLQFGAVEVAALEKLQRYFVNPRLAPVEVEFLPAFPNRTVGAHLWFVCARLRLRSNDNPGSALRARDARAHNAMGHREIIWAASLLSLSATRGDRQPAGSATDVDEELVRVFSHIVVDDRGLKADWNAFRRLPRR